MLMNNKNILVQELYRLSELFWQVPNQSPMGGNPSEQVLEQMESLLMNYLKDHPQDTDMWLKLTMVEFTPPWEDYDRIEKYINSILKYDENNVQALLVLANTQCALRGEITEDLFIRLQNVCNVTTNKELLSMIYLAIAWYCYSWPSYRDEKKYELSLLKSIQYCSEYVKNYARLGELYLKTGRDIEGKKMIHCALANVRKIYGSDDDSVYDITDVTSFFDEYYKGTHITTGSLESLRKLLD